LSATQPRDLSWHLKRLQVFKRVAIALEQERIYRAQVKIELVEKHVEREARRLERIDLRKKYRHITFREARLLRIKLDLQKKLRSPDSMMLAV
jgi:hypothetical protein